MDILVTVTSTGNITSPPGNSLAIYVRQSDGVVMAKDINGKEQPLKDLLPGGGGSGGLTSVTYAEAQVLVAGETLTPGALYLITDFQTIYDQPDYDSDGAQKTEVATLEGPVSPIIIQAATTNTFFEWALQPEYPDDQLQYDFPFNTTEIMGAPAKGRITERKDSSNVRTDYDHRVVLFKRYLTDTEAYYSYKDNGEASRNFLTFLSAEEDPEAFNVYLGNYTPSEGEFLLSNNVFFNGLKNFTIGVNSINNTFYGGSKSSIGLNCSENVTANVGINNCVIGNDFQLNSFFGMNGNIIGDSFNQNTISSTHFDNNKIGSGFFSNTIAGEFNSNEILDFFYENTVGTEFQNNLVKTNCHNNNFGSQVGYNKIGIEFSTNIIGSIISNNSIGNFFQNNTIGDNFTNNTIGASSTGNEWLNDVIGNKFGDNFVDNNIGSNFESNTIGNDAHNNQMGSTCQWNIIGNLFSGNTIGDGAKTNQIGDIFENNVIGIGFSDNLITSSFQNNTSIGDGFIKNVINFQFVNNVIGADCANNCFFNEFGGSTVTANFQSNFIQTLIDATNFTGATHVYAAYTCNLIKDSSLTNRLYYVNSDVLQFAAITD